jgi:hypothetical protein
VWDSAAFSSIFLASSFSCSQALSTPAHTQVTQAVRCFAEKPRAKSGFVKIEIYRLAKVFFSGGFGRLFFLHFGSAFGTAPVGNLSSVQI